MPNDNKGSFWPDVLAHIPKEKPWTGEYVTVAEIRESKDDSHSDRTTISALVPIDELDECRPILVNFSHDVGTSGPHPYFYEGGEGYEPLFWVSAEGTPSERYEALVQQWQSNDKTVLQIDQGFLMTYGLTPRIADQSGLIIWDDPALPRRGVVEILPVSVYDMPNSTPAYVRIAKDYLQDYLTIRGMALVQSYYEKKWCDLDEKIEAVFEEGEQYAEIITEDRNLSISTHHVDGSKICCQVWGARIVAVPSEAPISQDPEAVNDLEWPGENGTTLKITDNLKPLEHVYVRDAVLEKYERSGDFNLHPETGGVSYGNLGGQWGIGYCQRIDRDLIRVELRKLYEGVPHQEVSHWHKFTVQPPSMDEYPDILNVDNVATRTKRLVDSLITLGECLRLVSLPLPNIQFSVEQMIKTRREAVEYSGWQIVNEADQVAHHIPLNMGETDFLRRCLCLSNFLIECLSEKWLRKMVLAYGVPEDDIEKFRSLKLLGMIVKMHGVADETGLSLPQNGVEIYNRFKEDSAQPRDGVPLLAALNDMRQLSGHRRGDDYQRKLTKALRLFRIDPVECLSGYGKALDEIYDKLNEELSAIASITTQGR